MPTHILTAGSKQFAEGNKVTTVESAAIISKQRADSFAGFQCGHLLLKQFQFKTVGCRRTATRQAP